MFVAIVDNHVFVRLSRRNLRQLGAIVQEPGVPNRYLVRNDETGRSLVVQVEDDEKHYEGRDPGPSPAGLA
jgi:hypothetical protein